MILREILGTGFEELRAGELRPVRVAVLDSGVDSTHEDLLGRITEAYHVELQGEGWKVVKGVVPSSADLAGHGTGVASMVASVAPNAEIVDVRVLGEGNTGGGHALLAGFRHALSLGVRIVNLSLASTERFARPLQDLCELAYRRNIIVVASKRNMPLTDLGYPAELSTAISVDCLAMAKLLSVAYLQHPPIEFGAHGEGLMVAAPGGGRVQRTGTSFATPVVSGLCALLAGAYPELRPFEIKTILKALASPHPAG